MLKTYVFHLLLWHFGAKKTIIVSIEYFILPNYDVLKKKNIIIINNKNISDYNSLYGHNGQNIVC